MKQTSRKHAKGQKEKEVPTDTQPQFELGDTAEDIQRRRREREERREMEERESREMEERERMTGNRDNRGDRRNRGDTG